MGVTEGDLQVYLDVDVILGNCTIPLAIPKYVFNERSAPA